MVRLLHNPPANPEFGVRSSQILHLLYFFYLFFYLNCRQVPNAKKYFPARNLHSLVICDSNKIIISTIFKLLIFFVNCTPTPTYFKIIISAEKRPLLGIGLPQGAPQQRPVLCHPHPVSRYLRPAMRSLSGRRCRYTLREVLLPMLRLPFCGRHSRTLLPQWPSLPSAT